MRLWHRSPVLLGGLGRDVRLERAGPVCERLPVWDAYAHADHFTDSVDYRNTGTVVDGDGDVDTYGSDDNPDGDAADSYTDADRTNADPQSNQLPDPITHQHSDADEYTPENIDLHPNTDRHPAMRRRRVYLGELLCRR